VKQESDLRGLQEQAATQVTQQLRRRRDGDSHG